MYLRSLDQRTEIKISLKTQCRKEASIRATIYNDHIENFWRALVQSGSAEGINEKYQAAVKLAKAHGFAYKTTQQVTSSSLNEIIERVRLVPSDNDQVARALLGVAEQPVIHLSECCELYWPLITDRLAHKSEHKIRKWKNPRIAAIKNFIDVVGDRAIHKVERSDVLAFRNWWSDKISKGLSADSANKQLRYVRDIMNTVAINTELDIDCDALFMKTRFQYQVLSRPPFEAAYVQETLLGGLQDLNEHYRMVLFAMADTGARVTEIFGLTPEDIQVKAEIPFIWIRPREGYILKTATSMRKIPLVGTALHAFMLNPNGFQMRGNPDTFSNVVNNYMRDKNLRPTQRHSAYSLRHTFKDRLRDAEAPEEVIDALMGHKKSGPKYGRGHKLETQHKWLNKIAFKIQD